MAVNEVDQPVGEIAGEIRTEVSRAILDEAAGHVDARKSFAGQLDVGVGFVVAQQDIETRLVLLDEVIFESQRFFFVIDEDVVDIVRFGDQATGFGVRRACLH